MPRSRPPYATEFRQQSLELVRADLAAEGVRVGRKRVARLMKAANLRGVSRRKKYDVTTQRAKKVRPASSPKASSRASSPCRTRWKNSRSRRSGSGYFLT